MGRIQHKIAKEKDAWQASGKAANEAKAFYAAQKAARKGR